jgi:hypothetical protein
VVLDKPGIVIARKFQKELNAVLKSKEAISETEYIARCSSTVGKYKVNMEKHRNRNVDMRRALSFNLRSKHTRKQDREKMMNQIGRVQPQRQTVFEPLVFGLARLNPERLPARIGCKQSRILKQVGNSKALLDKSLPPEASKDDKKQSWVCPFRKNGGPVCKQVNPVGMRNCASCKKRCPMIPHAATKRGRAALVAIRLTKQPKMRDSKTPLMNHELCGMWGAAMFQPKGF